VKLDGGAEPVTTTHGPLAAGTRAQLALPIAVSAGTNMYRGALRVEFGDDSVGEMPLAFAVEAASIPHLTLASLSLSDGAVVLKSDQALAFVEYTTARFEGAAQVSKVVVEGGVLEVNVRLAAFDAAAVREIDFVGVTPTGARSPTLRVRPFRLAIPHEELHFASNQSRVAPSEIPKLEAVLTPLNAHIARYGQNLPLVLFIAGHTDTVGDAQRNRRLSQARAEAIGRWFQCAGVSIPIRTRGFGEDQLLVVTPDQTAESRNRRADYVLAFEPPMGPNAAWNGLAASDPSTTSGCR